MLSCVIVIGAANAPERNSKAKSSASCKVRAPVIWNASPNSLWMVANEITSPLVLPSGCCSYIYAIDASRNLLRVICAAPPAFPRRRVSRCRAPTSTVPRWPPCWVAGGGGDRRVMDMQGVLDGSERMTGILHAGLQRNALIEGHLGGLCGHRLQAYLAAGVSSDHELTSAADALEKLRAGLTLQLRGSHPLSAAGDRRGGKLLPLLPNHPLYRRCAARHATGEGA